MQKEASPDVWSAGVSLTRADTTFVQGVLTDTESVVQLRIKGQPISPKVTLYFLDEDWDCDCDSGLSPCSHVVGALIAERRGMMAQPLPEQSAPTSEKNLAVLHYRFRRQVMGLSFERLIVAGDKRGRLETSLTSYVGGLQAGRFKGPELLATKADFAVDAVLKNYRSGEVLERERCEALFKNLDVDQKVFLDDMPVQISTEVISVQAELVDEGQGYRIRRIKNPSVTEFFKPGVVLCTDSLKLVGAYRPTSQEARWVEGEGTYWGPEHESKLLNDILPAIQKVIPVDVKSLRLPQVLELKPWIDLLLEKEKSPSGEEALSVVANIVYGNPPLMQLNPQTLDLSPTQGTRGPKAIVRRDVSAERQLMAQCARELDVQVGRRIRFEGQMAVDFTYRVKTWNFRGNGFAAFHPEGRILKPRFELKEGDRPRFDFNFGFDGTEATVDFARVYQAWSENADAVPLLDGTWAQLPKDFMKRYALKIRELLLSRDARQEIPKYKIPELAAFCEEIQIPYPESFKKLKDLLENFQSIPKSSLPSDLKATLRHYQQEGVNWLGFLRDAKLGGMLADDMGLGKTLQALCAIRGKTLVVAPTSVLLNWVAELKKFRPSLTSCLYYGGNRKLDDSADVVLTSYGVLRLDQEILSEAIWDTVVLDEAQTIKNPDSQVARAAHKLQANFKLTLSGTPVENRLDDLWSQFHFINPGLLEDRESFLEKFARPIGRGDAEAAQKLRKRIKPFILRRLKKEVAPELPARTETLLRCELSSSEREVYESLLAASRKEVLALLEEGAGGMMKALEVILRLRQACCHLSLVPGQRAESSSKLELLMESLEESLSEGHKSLIFSQWTSFLDLMQNEFEKRNFKFDRIDGSTRNRMEIVDRFQSPDGPPLMLISLKAGGVGLNLTSADHVYIMDPWWNPSVEDQAADRAHRIGQQNPVFIHRLVAADSIEERIILLQEKKKDLAKAVLEEGTAALGLSRQDILDLLG